jgi:hypothetical protein
MRVVDRKTFLALPAGTIYCKGVPWAFDGICIKDDSLANDWVYLDPAWPSAHDSGEAIDLLEKSLEAGSSFPCESDFGRDGCFNDDAVFLIFETDDLFTLKNHIETAIDIASQSSGAGQPPKNAR